MTHRERISRIAVAAAGPALPFAWPWRLHLGDPRRWLARCIDTEAHQRRLFPWLAVFFGSGILLFFAADGEPAPGAPVVAAGLALVLAVALRRRPLGLAMALAALAVACGFAAAVLRQRSVHAPALEALVIAPLAGFVEAVEERGAGARLLIRVHELGSLAAERRPKRVRVTVRELGPLRPGAFVRANARLLPPPEPALPGGYDFARDAYFRGVGAVGSLVGRIEIRAPPVAPDRRLALAAGVDDARNAMTRRIADAIGGQAGAVAAALITGKRGLIDERTNDNLRAAGIYHIVSISGLHMVLAAGTVFALVRALLALSAQAALTWPIKKIAALAAMAGATAYCIFSGSDVAAERSLVMTLVMLGAILVDRPALSLRNLALSALIVLAFEPETLLGPSFQMSYGAVLALIAAAEWARARRALSDASATLPWIVRWTLAAVGGCLATTLIATFATAPFGTYHFHTLNPFGLIGNALALPLVSIAVMPSAIVGMLAYPFGLDGPVWSVMGFAVEGVLRVSAWVSGFANSTVVVPAFGTGALLCFTAALVTACLFVSPLRWLAAGPLVVGAWAAAAPERLDIYVDREGRGAAVRRTASTLVALGQPSSFTIEQWLRADGDMRKAEEQSLREGVRCDAVGCTAKALDGRMVALVTDRRAFEEDCRRAAVVISKLRAPQGCAAPVVIDRELLRQHGAVALKLTPSGVKLIPAREVGRTRAWKTRPLASQPSTAARSPTGAPPRPAPDEALAPEPETEEGQ